MSTPFQSREPSRFNSNVEPFRWPVTHEGPLGTGSIIKERFVLGKQIGRGGMGTVYVARDLRKVEARDRNPDVALKILDEDINRHAPALATLQHEARKAQILSHPNIISIYDFGRDGAAVYLVMELLEGESLDRIIERTAEVGVGLDEALRITHEICRAMSYAHERGVMHADFKPANAFLTSHGVVKVLDFGIARALKHNDRAEISLSTFDPEALSARTLAYAGCEVVEGAEPDIRDDIYAIACVFYELLTGRHPLSGFSAAEARRLGLGPSRPPKLSRRQWQTLKRALQFRRDQRPASVSELLAGLLPRQRPTAFYVGATAASVLVAGAIFVVPEMSQRNMGQAFATGKVIQIEDLLPPESQAGPTTAQTSSSRETSPVIPPATAPEMARDPGSPVLPELLETTDKPGTRMAATNEAPNATVTQPKRPRKVARVRKNTKQTDSTAAASAARNEPELWMLPRIAEDPAVKITELKRTLVIYAQANEVQAAVATLDELRARLPAEDDFIQTEGPQAIAQGYLRLASDAVKQGQIENALRFATQGRDIAPKFREALTAQVRYAEYFEIGEDLKQRERYFIPQIRLRIWRVSRQAPWEMQAVRQRWAQDLADRIDATEDRKLAARLAKARWAIFPETEQGSMDADNPASTISVAAQN